MTGHGHKFGRKKEEAIAHCFHSGTLRKRPVWPGSPDPSEQAALTAIRKLRRRGNTLRGIAAVLNQQGHRTRRGSEWGLESVARIVRQSSMLLEADFPVR